MKVYSFVFPVVILICIVGFGQSLTVEAAELRLHALINGERFDGNSGQTNELAVLIDVAERLYDNTVESPDGAGIPSTLWWATPGDFYTFRNAINHARNFLDVQGNTYFERNATFDISFVLEQNPGFTSLLLTLTVPEGLEIVGFAHNNLTGFLPGFMHPRGIDFSPHLQNPSFENPFTGNVRVGWYGLRFNNFYGEGNLFRFTFRVREDAEPGLSPILLSLNDGNPYNLNGAELRMYFEDVSAVSWEICGINILP
ncbi:MAG: hypothetical protein FWF79_10085 [Defluviitaleaceae bacterium]|nr:hypothetical protein [Defluviitaleaceae bacterium]